MTLCLLALTLSREGGRWRSSQIPCALTEWLAFAAFWATSTLLGDRFTCPNVLPPSLALKARSHVRVTVLQFRAHEDMDWQVYACTGQIALRECIDERR